MTLNDPVFTRDIQLPSGTEVRAYHIPGFGMLKEGFPSVEVTLPARGSQQEILSRLEEPGQLMVTGITEKDRSGQYFRKLDLFAGDWILAYKPTGPTWDDAERILSGVLESIPGAEAMEFVRIPHGAAASRSVAGTSRR
jgi:hypothetical protein